jgi:hypothetical protein
MGEAKISFSYTGIIRNKEMYDDELGQIVKNNYAITEEIAAEIVRRILSHHFTTESLRIKEAHYFH